jgi:type II secretion system protein N
MKPPLRRKLLLWMGTPAFFVGCFLLFAYWTFPYDHLRDYLVQEVERPRGPGGERIDSGLRLRIDELSPSLLTGVTLRGVTFTKLPSSPDERPAVVSADEIHARVSLLALLRRVVAVSFSAEMAGGSLEGEVQVADDEVGIEVKLEGLELRRVGIFAALAGLPVSGTLGGTVGLTLAKEARNTQGSVDLAVDRIVVGDARAKLKLPGLSDGLTVGRVEAGNLKLRATVTDGSARIDELSAEGRDLTLRGRGTVRLGLPLQSTARADLLLSVKFTEAFRTRDDRTRAMFSLLDLNPGLAPARTPDGALQFQLLASPVTGVRAVPAGSSRMR